MLHYVDVVVIFMLEHEKGRKTNIFFSDPSPIVTTISLTGIIFFQMCTQCA